jgi:uncharacterized protein
MPVQVLPTSAEPWRDHVGDQVPILASGPWIEATLARLTSKRLSFLADDAGLAGGLQATVVDEPATGEMLNLYRTLAGLAARPGLRAKVPPAQDWLPQLAVLYPGFDTFVAAAGVPTPSLTASLVDGVLSWAGQQEMKAVSFPYVRAGTDLPQPLAERGFRRVPLTYRSSLTLDGDFGDYLASLSSSSRSQVTRERRRMAAAGVRTERRDVDDAWDDVLALRCDLVERYGQRADKELEEASIRRLVTSFGTERTRLYCSFLDGQMVGFSLFVVWRDTWYLGYTGTYQSPQTRSVYFDHFFYAPIGGMLAEGARVLDAGIGAWEGKRRRGCALAPVDLWVKALDPAIHRAITLAAPHLRREVGW